MANEENDGRRVLKVPVTKAKDSVQVYPNDIPDEQFQEIVEAGLKVAVNGGMSKVTKENYPNEEEFKLAAMVIAEERVKLMMEGKLKIGRKTATKGPSGPVMTEARRLAREVVKQILKDNGLKVIHYSASEITRAANDLLTEDPSYIKQATANIEARKHPPKAVDVSKMIADPKLVAKAEAAKAEKRAAKLPGGILSKTQAGKVQPRHATH